MEAPVLRAWFTKAPEKRGKAQRRWFEFYFLPLSAELRYYEEVDFDAEQRVTNGKTQKGAIPILPGSLILFRSDLPELAVHNPNRTWRLHAEDSATAAEWGQLLRRVVNDAKAVEQGQPDPRSRFDGVEPPVPARCAPRAPEEV